MTRYQVPKEETSINFTNISEQVYCIWNWGDRLEGWSGSQAIAMEKGVL